MNADLRAHIVKFRSVKDERGTLTASEFGETLPFMIQRMLMLGDAPGPIERGSYAQRNTPQFIVCPKGMIRIDTEDLYGKQQFVLSTLNCGLYIPLMNWVDVGLQQRALALIFSPEPHVESDRITDRTQFKNMLKGTQ